ncbi:MAG: hypothetical protein ACI8QZ_001202 [Chlamydiales bacterium]
MPTTWSSSKALGVPLFLWSRTKGLSCAGADGSVYETTEPAKLLAHMQAADTDGIFLLADFCTYLEDALVARHFRETVRGFTGDRRAILLSGVNLKLPA